jgi:peptidoglycan-associated lipoprotein
VLVSGFLAILNLDFWILSKQVLKSNFKIKHIEGYMKRANLYLIINLMLICLSLTGCRRNSDDVWDDTKSAGRHVNRGFRSLGGKNGDSRAVTDRNSFYSNDEFASEYPPEGEYIPLQDAYNNDNVGMSNCISQQPRETPGDPGSSIPGIDYFRDASTIPGLAHIFNNIQFDLNSYMISGQENLDTLRNIADYMKSHENTYVFVEGHCCEKGPEAYNLALGARRANSVRNMLIQAGVNPDNVFTISYGKERPLVMERHEEALAQNRRAEFKIYQR